MTTSLSLSTLSDITRAHVPAYAREDLTAGIVHMGVGNFHRAHQIVSRGTGAEPAHNPRAGTVVVGIRLL